MSDQRRFVWKSGRLISSPITDFLEISLTEQDPQIPNLPVETPAAAGGVTLTLDATQAADAVSATVTAPDNLNATITAAGDTLLSGVNAVGVLAATIAQTGDSVAASVALPIVLTAAPAQAGDTLLATVGAVTALVLDTAQAGDTLAGAVVVPIAAALDATVAGDALAGSIGNLVVLNATLAAAGDTLDATAIVGDAGRTLDAALTQAGDTLSATATSDVLEIVGFGLGHLGVVRPRRRLRPATLEAQMQQAGNVVVAFATVRGRTRAARDEEWVLRRAA